MQNSYAAMICAVGSIPMWCSIARKIRIWFCVLFDLIYAFCWVPVAYITNSAKVASLALELLCKGFDVGAPMADDMGKLEKSESCVNILGYVARDGVSKSVTELKTTHVSHWISQWFNVDTSVEGVSTAGCHYNTLNPGQIELHMAD